MTKLYQSLLGSLHENRTRDVSVTLANRKGCVAQVPASCSASPGGMGKSSGSSSCKAMLQSGMRKNARKMVEGRLDKIK